MAQETVILKLIVDDGQLKGATAAIDKQSKAVDKHTKKQKQGTKTSNRYNKAEKALYQTNLSGSKAFSKMNQTMGGSGGVVAAYATLAANVFALTAAFGALSRAAEFDTLTTGLVQLGAASGQTLSVMADGLREITGGAISVEEAMRGAALGVSGGFGGEQLEGLARIAKGASITLGRDLSDAFDRLTRGAIKLEPEILDELGIMVRLDDAVEDYAAQIGKSAGALTQMERRQAFMNAILVQGEAKFGAIADSVDPSPYAKLGATFGDLTRKIFNAINKFTGLGVAVGFLADNIIVLFGVMILFGSTLAGKMLPFLSDTARKARDSAKGLHEMAAGAHEAQKMTQRAMAGRVAKSGVGSDPFKSIMGQYASGDIEGTVPLANAQKKLRQGITQLKNMKKKASVEEAAQHQQKINQYNREIKKIGDIIELELGRGKASVIANNADLMAKAADEAADSIDLYQAGIVGLRPTMNALGAQFGPIRDGLLKNSEGLGKNGRFHKMYQKALANSTAFTTVLGNKLKVLGAAFMKALPLIGLITVAAGIAYFAVRKIFITEEVKEYKEQLKKISEILENQAEISRKYLQSQETIRSAAARQLQAYQQISGVVKETNTELKKAIILRKLADASKPGSMGLGKGSRQATGAARGLMRADDVAVTTGAASAGGIAGILGQMFAGDPAGGGMGAIEKQTAMFGARVTEMLQGLSKEARETEIAGIFEIDKTPEWQFFQSALTSDIPTIASAAAEHFSRVMGKSFKDPKDRAAALASAYDLMEAQLGQVGNAAQGISDGLKESEKEASKFLTTFAKKTKVTELGKQMRGMTKNIKFMKQEMDKLDPARTTEEIGLSLSAVGSTVSKMVGQDFHNQVQAVADAEKDIEDVKKKQYKTTEQQAVAMAIAKTNLGLQAHILGGMEELFNQAVDDVNEIERSEITTAQTLKQISSIQGTINKLKESSVNFSKQEHTLLLEKIRKESELAKTTSKLIAKQFATTTNTGEAIKLNEKLTIAKGEQITLDQMKTLNAEEQLVLAKALGIDLSLVYSKEQADILIITKGLEKKKAILSSSHNEMMRGAEILKKELEMQHKSMDLLREKATIEQRIANFRSGMGTELTASQEIAERIKAAKEEAEKKQEMFDVEMTIIRARANLQLVELYMLNEQMKMLNDGEGLSKPFMASAYQAIGETAKAAGANLTQELENSKASVTLVLASAFGDAMKAAAEGEGAMAIAAAVTAATAEGGDGGSAVTTAELVGVLRTQAQKAVFDLKQLGPTGEAYAEVIQGFDGIAQGFMMIANAGKDSAQKIQGVISVFQGMAQAFQGISDAKVAALDEEIKAEEARDGKSKQSLDKIKAMKMKQYMIEKKAFELNKKVKLANAVVDGMAAIQSGFATEPFLYLGLAMGAMATAMTMTQIKTIQATKFAGKPPEMGGAAPVGAINVGKRTNKVDVSKGASVGELAYLRGQRGIGTTATNFQAQGGAAGLRKGYATGGEVLVGERGPETITPLTGLNVVPAGQGAKSQINANFTIHAIDAAGVEEVLLGQQGNIINMIRSAANDYGTDFLEEVDVDTYGDFSSGTYGGG